MLLLIVALHIFVQSEEGEDTDVNRQYPRPYNGEEQDQVKKH